MQERESEVDRFMKREIHYFGYLYIKLTGTNANGLPDRMILGDGKVFFVEMKRPGEKPRKLQQIILRKLYRKGFRVYTVDNKRTAERLAEKIGGGCRGIHTSSISEESH